MFLSRRYKGKRNHRDIMIRRYRDIATARWNWSDSMFVDKNLSVWKGYNKLAEADTKRGCIELI